MNVKISTKRFEIDYTNGELMVSFETGNKITKDMVWSIMKRYSPLDVDYVCDFFVDYDVYNGDIWDTDTKRGLSVDILANPVVEIYPKSETMADHIRVDLYL